MTDFRTRFGIPSDAEMARCHKLDENIWLREGSQRSGSLDKASETDPSTHIAASNSDQFDSDALDTDRAKSSISGGPRMPKAVWKKSFA